MKIKVYTDGGSLGNPGLGAYAYVIYLNDKIAVKNGKPLGLCTNNFAEYMALTKALEKIKSLIADSTILHRTVEKINVFSDSALMVNQLNGLFKVKNGQIREFIMQIRILEGEIKIPITYTYIPREKNTLADSLVKKAFTKR